MQLARLLIAVDGDNLHEFCASINVDHVIVNDHRREHDDDAPTADHDDHSVHTSHGRKRIYDKRAVVLLLWKTAENENAATFNKCT